MANYLPLPNGTYLEIPEGMSDAEALGRAKQAFPDLFPGLKQAEPAEDKSGFFAGLKGGFESLKGDIGAIGAGLGIEGGAEYAAKQREEAAKEFEQAQFSEDPVNYVLGLLGQSAAYMAAPAAAAAATLALPVTGTAATLAGLGAAGLTSAAQFTGSNLQRQLEEGTAPEDLKLGYAVSAAVPQAALDTVALKMLPGVGKLLGKWGIEPTKEQALAAARKLAEASAAGLVKAGGVQVVKNAGIEGLTESAQQVFERMQAGLELMDDKARQEYIDNFVGGATLGGLFGAGSRIGAQGRAKAVVGEEDRRLAAEEAKAQQQQEDERLAQLTLEAERGAETRAMPYVEAATQAQGVLPGMEAVEPEAPAAAQPPSAEELFQEQQYLQRVLEDNRMQQSELGAAGDFDAQERLDKQYQALDARLAEVNNLIKDTGAQDVISQRVKLQKSAERVQNRLQQLTGEAFDPIEARELRGKLNVLNQQLQQLGGDQLAFQAPLRTLTDPLAYEQEQAALELQRRQEELEKAAAPRLETQTDMFGQQMDELAEEGAALEKEELNRLNSLFGDALQGVAPAIKLPETTTPLPAGKAKRDKAVFDKLLSDYDKLSNSLIQSDKVKAAEIRSKLNALRSGEEGSYLKAVLDARAEQDTALADFSNILTQIRQGVYFGGKGDIKEATNTLEGLRKQADEARAKYIQNALLEAATHRRAAGTTDISTNDALKAAADMDARLSSVLEEMSTRATATRDTEEKVETPAQMRANKLVRGAQTTTRDTRPLAQRPFGAPAAAEQVLVDSLNELAAIRDSLLAPAPARRETPLLKTQFQATEAQRVAEERGETATTLGGELRRRTDFVRQKMSKMGGMRPMASRVLNEAADLMDEGRVSRDLLDTVEPVVDAIVSKRQITQTDLRAIKDATTAIRQAAAGEDGQRQFDLPLNDVRFVPGKEPGEGLWQVDRESKAKRTTAAEDLGYIRATAANFAKSPLVRSAREAIDNARAAVEAVEEQNRLNQTYRDAYKSVVEKIKKELNSLSNKSTGLEWAKTDVNTLVKISKDTFHFMLTRAAALREQGNAAQADEIEAEITKTVSEYNKIVDSVAAAQKKTAAQVAGTRAEIKAREAELTKQLKTVTDMATALERTLTGFKAVEEKASKLVTKEVVAKVYGTVAQEIRAQQLTTEALEQQREDWNTAYNEAKAQIERSTRATFNSQISRALNRLAQIDSELKGPRLRNAVKNGSTNPEILGVIEKLQADKAKVQERLEKAQIEKEKALADDVIRAKVLLDSNVQFEANVLAQREKELAKLIAAANTPAPQIQAAQRAAQEQRTRVAVAETKRAEEVAAQDRAARAREVRMNQRYPGAVLTRINGVVSGYVTKEEAERSARIAEAKRVELQGQQAAEREDRKPQRALGPVTRGASPAPSAMRTGTTESKAGETKTGGAQTELTEARGEKQRNVPITETEMQTANRVAEELKKLSEAQRAKQVKEAEKVAKELTKLRKGNLFEEDFELRADDDVVLREMNSDYEMPSRTALKVNVLKALRAGDVNQVLSLLSENGSTPLVRKLAAVLQPLVGNVKIEIVPELYDKGVRAAGLYKVREMKAVFDENALTEETILHELIHAATLNALRSPINTLTEEQRAARRELEAMFKAVSKNKALVNEYGLNNIEEFASELLSNRVLQGKLSGMKWFGGTNVFSRFINRVLAFLGLKDGVDFRGQASQNVLALFEPAKPMDAREDVSEVASILRGVFPGTAARFDADVPMDVQESARATTARQKGFADKVMASLFSPSAPLAWRTQLLDRFAPIEELLRKGVARGVLPDMQLFQTMYYLRFGEQRSQYVAQAASNGVARRAKQPDGTYVIESKDGMNIAKIAETLRSAGIGNEQAAEEMFTTWMAGLRAGQGKIGWDKLNLKNPASAKKNWEKVNAYIQGKPQIRDAFQKAREQYREYNADLLDFLVESGAMSKDEGARLKALEYIPFYRMDGDAVELMIDKENTVRIGDIKNQPYLKELVGGEDTILPFFSSALQNTNMIMDMALRNIQTKDVAYVLNKMDGAEIRKGSGPAQPNVIRFREHGEVKHAIIDTDAYGVPADLLVKGMEGIKTTIPAAVQLMRWPANLLRKTVTLMPSYALRQVIRDPLNSWLVTGGKFTPVASSFKELGKMVGGKSVLEETLQKAGAISSNVFSNDREDIERILRNTAGGKGGWQKMLSKMEGFAIQGDSATRAVLYKMYRDKGMTHMQALLGSLESMNFTRRGVSPSMQFMSMMVPFFNAQVQGLDVIYRAARGKSLYEKEMDVRATMLKRGLMMAAGTMAYAALMQDDDSYKNATPEQRALNWFVPLPGVDASLKVPIPFELGYAFKAIPEMVYNTAFGDEKASTAMKTVGKLAYQTVPIGLPQGIKPIVEVATNYSFFTGENIESQRLLGLSKDQRYTDNTSQIAKALSAMTFSTLSPAQVEYLVRGYTSTLGVTLMQLPDVALRPLSGEVERPTRLINEYPIIGTLFQPADGRGIINAAYDRMEDFQQASNTFQTMLREGRRADAQAYAQKYATEIAANSIGGYFRQQMGELAKLRRAVSAAPNLSGDEKREKINQIRKLEIRLAERIKQVD